jgi:hypothetical protein
LIDVGEVIGRVLALRSLARRDRATLRASIGPPSSHDEMIIKPNSLTTNTVTTCLRWVP